MRILALSYEYPPLGGGGGVAVAHSARSWVARGHAVTLVTSGTPELPAHEVSAGVQIYRLPVVGRTARATASLPSLLSFPLVATRFVTNQWQAADFDLLLSCFAIPSGVAGMRLAQIWDLPHAVWVMGGDAYDPSKALSPHRVPILKQTVATVLGTAQAIMTMSHDMADRVRHIYQPAVPIHVIPQGLALEAYAPSPRTPGIFTVVSVARLVRRKRLDNLIRAFALLPPGCAQLRIIGDGPEQARLQHLVNELGLAERVDLLGYVDEAAKLALLRQADCFALVSEHEGFGLVYLEAAAQGLPIIAGTVGGQVDFLRHGTTGWLVAHDDPEGLRAGLLALINQPQLCAWMGQQALDMAQAYQIERVADRFLEVLNATLTDHKASI